MGTAGEWKELGLQIKTDSDLNPGFYSCRIGQGTEPNEPQFLYLNMNEKDGRSVVRIGDKVSEKSLPQGLECGPCKR